MISSKSYDMHRREFLRVSGLVAAASTCSSVLSNGWAKPAAKRVLVLGGTFFVGPALIDALLADGHTVTLFNRGVTNADLFQRVEKLKGFRSSDPNDQDLSALSHRRFDVVVDVWANEPEVVALAAEFLKARARHYLFVSSVGAYDHREFAKPGVITEEAPLEPWTGSGRTYDRNKAESERRLHKIIGEPLTIARPGPIKGHGDRTPDLLTWLVRAQEGGEHIAPGDGGDPVEFVDVKDVARFLALTIEKSLYGTFNLTGRSVSFRELLDACKVTTRSDATFTWIPQQFLHEHGLDSDRVLHTFAGNFPLWIPEPQYQGIYRISSEKAFRSGWKTRPFDETAFDCLLDFRTGQLKPSTFLTCEREKEVLDAWHRQP
jgi:2'-hydroxyisoflavone reductase